VGQILTQLIQREIAIRYRGSVLGVLWSFLTPLLLLAVFTFVFAVVFRARWGTGGETSVREFALILFAGLTTFNLFSEVVGRAPIMVTSQPNLVKKVVFPLEVLPVVALGSALFQAGIAMAMLVVFQIALGTGFHATALLVPLLVVPLCLVTLGLSWFLAALGVYVRDVGQVVPPLLTALMFLNPVFYPASALPDWIRPLAVYSPLAYSVEAVRGAVIFGTVPDPVPWMVALAGGLGVAALGFAFFQKTRKGFADVL
jgi:lipopolysaccharide transport system permease protein